MKTPVGIILGSGLNQFAKELISPQIIYEDNNSFHKLQIYSGKINQEDIVIFSGRRHYYEGYPNEKILENITRAKDLGIKLLIITNAAGGINKNFNVADLMLMTSHINFFNKVRTGNSDMYDREIIDKIRIIAKEEKINLKYGSYCCSSGPMYETKSETRFFSKYGVDAVGMSTVPEIIFAAKNGIKTIGFSCITNLLAENINKITHHDEVIDAGKKAYTNFSKLLKTIISKSSLLIE